MQNFTGYQLVQVEKKKEWKKCMKHMYKIIKICIIHKIMIIIHSNTKENI